MIGSGLFAPRRHRSRRAQVAATIVAAALLVLSFSPGPARTSAAWTDAEHASGALRALTLPAVPGALTCVAENIVVIVVIKRNARVSWTAPAGGLPSGTVYEVRVTNTTATPDITRSAFTASTNFLFSDGLLSGLLSGLLTGNAAITVEVFVAIPSIADPTVAAWRSLTAPARNLSYTGGLLTGDFTCA